MPGFFVDANKNPRPGPGVKVPLAFTMFQVISVNDAIRARSIHPATAHPASIVRLAFNRFIIAVFMVIPFASVRCSN